MKPFLDIYEKNQREERDRMNFHAYMTGVYVRDAIGACFSKNGKFPDKPYDLRSQEEKASAISPEEYARRMILMQKYQDKERKLQEKFGGGEMNGR